MASMTPPSFTVEEEPEGAVLTVRGDWSAEAERALAEGRADSLRLNYAHGFRERSLDFIGAWPLRRVEILARTLTDVTPLYRLSNSLEHLQLTVSPRAELDLKAFPLLRSLSAAWPQVAATVNDVPLLERLFLLGYNEPDFLPLTGLRGLRSLRLKEIGSLSMLDGIEQLTQLEQLHVVGARHLTELRSLADFPGRLRDLWLQSSLSRLAKLDGLGNLKALEVLNIANCGTLDSLSPLTSCLNLRVLYAWESTRIADGDLSVLLNLPLLAEVRMMNRRHYTPSVDEVRSALGNNRG